MLLLEDKKRMLLELTKLNMDLEKAYLIAECTDEDIKTLEKDEYFTRQLSVQRAIEERRLLEWHQKACKIAMKRGSASGIQWKLSKINPDKWGDKKDTGPIFGTLLLSKDDEEL